MKKRITCNVFLQIVEAVYEDMNLKLALFKELDKICKVFLPKKIIYIYNIFFIFSI